MGGTLAPTEKKRRWLATLFFVRTTTKLFGIGGWGGSEFSTFDGTGGAGGHGRHSCRGSVAFHKHGYHSAFGFFYECHSAFGGHVYANEVSEPYLPRGNEISQRKNQMPFDRALQVTGSVFWIGAFVQQETLHLVGAVEDELIGGRRHQDALLHAPEFDVKDLLQVVAPERAEDDHLVDAVQELRRELALRRLARHTVDLPVERLVVLRPACRESQAARHELVNLRRAQVGGHEDHGAGQVHPAIVAERQGGLVQDAEEELPERVARLLDLVEEHQRELDLFAVVLFQRLLGDQRLGLPVAQVSGRRADQLGDLVAVLELGAVDLQQARASPNSTSDIASTTRVLPEPVGPSRSRLPTGRPGGFNPARNI